MNHNCFRCGQICTCEGDYQEGLQVWRRFWDGAPKLNTFRHIDRELEKLIEFHQDFTQGTENE